MTPLRLAILISGRGTNMEAILRAAEADDYPARPVLVLSNRPEAQGLETAANAGLSAVSVDHKAYGKDRESFERALQSVLIEHQIEMVVLAGFMRILTPWFVSQWTGRMINIHPSLLPKYPGLHTHQRALDSGDAEAGCSVHWVTEGVDEGGVIAQARVSVLANDTADTLADRVLGEEHKLYPKAVALAAEQIRSKKKPLSV
ncbi:MAG: phosphoribosylglycinamide formyltransferase [Henriciella sp.]|nr:phosphoribosylglycinamide formyltransferase [Henriciella sp.]MBO6694682.1 phosphoribosylglycinamide formyltransferase [Henriciella sp.]